MFGTWKNGISIAGFLAGLYTFIYILIQLEDTALLAGSIGLFLLVAVAMHFSKKIDWYGTKAQESEVG
jgi:inner membrane protein